MSFPSMVTSGVDASRPELSVKPSSNEGVEQTAGKDDARIIKINSGESLPNRNVELEKKDSAITRLRKKRRQRLRAGWVDIENEDGWDTDLEEQEGNGSLDFDPASSKVYLETCKQLGVVPASYFVRHMKEAEMIMKHHGLGPLGVKAMALPLVANTSILVLDLEDNWLEEEGGVYVADMLRENCFITDLNLAENHIGLKGGRAICEMLALNSTLRCINLAGNNLGDKEAEYFATALLENNRINELDLSHNNFGDASGNILGHAIGENESLEVLNLSWNNFRRLSGVAILDGIRVSSRLKKVDLAWNGIGNEGAIAVADLLKHNSILTELDLSSNRISADGCVAIAKGLEANETLKVLHMGQNPIYASGALILLNAINNERSVLQLLDLTEVWVNKEFDRLLTELRESHQLDVRNGGILENYVIKGPFKKPPRLSDKSVEDLMSNQDEAIWEALQASVEKHRAPLARYVEQYDPGLSFQVTTEEFVSGVKQTNLGLNDEQLKALNDRLQEHVASHGVIDYSCFDY